MAIVSYTTDSYREIERYMERAQEEIHKAFHELQRCEDFEMISDSEINVLPRPPSGDFQLLASWAEDFPRAVQQSMSETLDTSSDLVLPYQRCKYGTNCPLLTARYRRAIQDKEYPICPSCNVGGRRTYSKQLDNMDYLTREVGIQTQWTDVHDAQWTSQDGALMRCKHCRQECTFEYLRYPMTYNADLPSQMDVNNQSSSIPVYFQNGNNNSSEPLPNENHSTRFSKLCSERNNHDLAEEISTNDNLISKKLLSSEKSHNGFLSEIPPQILENDIIFENGRCRSAENVADSKINQEVKEQYSASLPKDLSRKSPVRDALPDRSASSSTLSSQVSRSELHDFMKRVESSTYRPPSPDKVEMEVNTDDVRRSSGELKDAITQTTPQLSRSSSFTWVTECECSDLDSTSEHSLLSFSCSTTTSSEIGEHDTSSTSSGSSALIDGIHDSYSSSLSLSSASSLKSDFSFDILSTEHAEDEPPNAGQDSIWEKREAEQKKSLTECGGDVTPDSGVETVVLTPELIKSSSVPALQRHLSSSGENMPLNRFDDNLISQTLVKHPIQFIELQTLEACMWLRAAGFPQYAQMYEENQFPIDLRTVQADHSFLDEDSLQSLFRRLDTLNRCVKMKAVDSVTRHSLPDDDSDEEELCALSNSWQFERSNHRWSRIPSTISVLDNILAEKYGNKKYNSSFSSDSVLGDDRQESPDSIRKSTSEYRRSSVVTEETLSISGSSSGGSPCLITDLGDKQPAKKSIRRTGSDRIKEGAKALLRRMDSLKGKKKKKNSQEESEAHDVIMVTTDISPSCSTNSSPKVPHQQSSPNSTTTEESSAGGDTSESSQGSTPKLKHRRKMWRLLGHDNPKSNSCNDVDQGVILFPDHWRDANFNDTKLMDHCVQSKNQKSSNRNILYSNEHFSIKQGEWVYNQRCKKLGDNIVTPVIIFNRTCSLENEKQKVYSPYVIYSPDDLSLRLTNSDPDISESTDTSINRGRRDSGVGSSLNRTLRSSNIQTRWHCFPRDPFWNTVRDPNSVSDKISIDTLSTPQLMVLRKFSLLKVTMLMEKYTPSSKTGWSWAVPKFIRRIRTPDYKDKTVFAVPLLLIVQRTGYPLPPSIQEAFHYLEETSLDTVGIFRKSGVRSRIQKLRNQNETNPEKTLYDNQQAYDVADMVKQYFRELPEALLTNKLSETFISIFQHVPEEQRLEAIQAAILLMPDENREVLHTLLSFLNKVYQHAAENQMTATNLAVCFAPSLFHLTTPRSASASPRRRKTVVVLDQKELNENRAAYECLTKMILEYKQLFTVSGYVLSHHHMSYLEHCQPATLDEFGKLANKTNSDWKLYIEGCINNLLKESREKYKGWVTVTQHDTADVAYKKVGDNYPLRLWKIVVEVEAPPVEVLNCILRERSIWDSTLLRCKVISKLEKQTEIFQYACSSLSPQPPRDYCVLRSWQTDLPKGTCILVEVSIDYSSTPLIVNSIQGVVLASRYLVEPCGSGKSRVTYISRIDMCGHSPEWYNKAYGSICAIQMSCLRDSFSHGTEGPETKV